VADIATKLPHLSNRPRPARVAEQPQARWVADPLTKSGQEGTNRSNLTGRLRRKRLPTGPYRATLTAKDEAGNASAPRRVKFTIQRPR
jgi:hypothetical protein